MTTYIQIVPATKGEHHFGDADGRYYQVLTFPESATAARSCVLPADLRIYMVQIQEGLTEQSTRYSRFIKDWMAYNELTGAPIDHLLVHYDFEDDPKAPRILVVHADYYNVSKQYLTRLVFEGLLSTPKTVTIV